jgi:hypothetical protein
MLVPLSKLDHYIAETILAVQRARAHVAAQSVPIDTDPPESVQFSIQVIDDTAPAINAAESQSIEPETTQTQTQGTDSSTSTTKQHAVTTEETQVNEVDTTVFNQPGGGSILVNELHMQYNGRNVTTTTEETL